MKRLGIIAAAMAAVTAMPAAAQELVTNGGFEAGFSGFTSSYGYVPAPAPNALVPEGLFAVGTNSANYHPLWASVTAHAGSLYLIANGAPGNNVNVWTQTLTTTIGQQYSFSAFINNVCCNSSFTGSNGTPVIVSINGGLLPVASGSANNLNNWVRISGLFTATGASTTFNIYNDNSVASGNDFGLDDISVTAVPEPTSWAMMIAGFGLAGFAMRRRRDAGTLAAA